MGVDLFSCLAFTGPRLGVIPLWGLPRWRGKLDERSLALGRAHSRAWGERGGWLSMRPLGRRCGARSYPVFVFFSIFFVRPVRRGDPGLPRRDPIFFSPVLFLLLVVVVVWGELDRSPRPFLLAIHYGRCACSLVVPCSTVCHTPASHPQGMGVGA